jgi:hypothetical protein
MADNLDTQTQDNTQTQTQDTTQSTASAFSWKSHLSADIKGSPTLAKFEDTPEGLGKAMESHLNLEKLLGQDKVPIPKDENDKEGWNRFSKAMGIPDKAEGYGLPDAEIPESMKAITFDKNKFAEVVHAYKLTPSQAKGLWKSYTDMSMQAYSKVLEEHKQTMTNVVNQLRSEWGDTYETNVELGQTVINKFSADKDTEDWLTATLSKDPRGVRFLAKVGNQFAENKVGEFTMKRFSLTPEQADAEINNILKDPKHPYNDEKASEGERNSAIDYVNALYAMIAKAKGQG